MRHSIFIDTIFGWSKDTPYSMRWHSSMTEVLDKQRANSNGDTITVTL